MGQAQIILATVMDKDELYLLLLAEMRWLYLQINGCLCRFVPESCVKTSSHSFQKKVTMRFQ
jgi:hypothetical protein